MNYPRIPRLSTRRWPVCYLPDLGEFSGPSFEGQNIVDHSFVERPDGTWQIWACIRGCAVSRLIYGWEGANPLSGWWKPMGVQLRADASLGEDVRDGTIETAGSPFFFKHNDRYDLFYHSAGIHLATSEDGLNYTRVINDKGTSHAGIAGGRDTMIMECDGTFYAYVTETNKEGICSVVCSCSTDLRIWDDGIIVSRGGMGGDGPVDAESPFVVQVDGYFYLFRTSSISFQTFVYRSLDPLDFGIDDDSKLVCTLDIKIPEIITYQGRMYISDLPDFHHLYVHELTWEIV